MSRMWDGLEQDLSETLGFSFWEKGREIPAQPKRYVYAYSQGQGKTPSLGFGPRLSVRS